MSVEESDAGEMPVDSTKGSNGEPEKKLSDVHIQSNGNVAEGNGSSPPAENSHEELVQMVIELKFQNEFLMSQFKGFKSLQVESDESLQKVEVGVERTGESADVKQLHETIEALNKELMVEKQTRGAAEEAMKHLREVYFEADAKAQELTVKLADGLILSVYCSLLYKIYFNQV